MTPHLAGPGRPVPVSTYRVQLRPPSAGHPGFDFDDAAGIVPYLADLGVTHLYCSPYLQAAAGSTHGYDVVDHSQLSSELGGDVAFERMASACRAAGLGIVLDIVPNHMAISEPESQNAPWWSVLRDGPSSPYADWFDIDWDSPGHPGRVLVPVLGSPLTEVLEELELTEDRVRYYGHLLPLAPGTFLPGDVLATLAGQHYELCDWRVAGEELNYRRFFDVTTLAGVRVELPGVFDQTHELVLQQLRDGVLDGLRIDHPDGLADPAGYLARLAEQTEGAWVVVEKILEPGEKLPDDWACAGTTGYDALNAVLGLFVDPAGQQPLTELWQAATGSAESYDEVVAQTKRLVLSDVLAAEVNRLTRVGLAACAGDDDLRGLAAADLRAGLVEVLASFGVYRAYLAPNGPAGSTARAQVQQALVTARTGRPDLAVAIEAVGRLALAEVPTSSAGREFVTRFQQTCGPVMAKGVEDTAFYRYLRLSGLNEVGGDPARFGTSVGDFHAFCTQLSVHWPLSMTTISTHDTKRSEDVRARLVLLSQCPARWARAVTRWSALADRHRNPAGPDPATEQLLWQTLVGSWPLPAERLAGYLTKATREAKAQTSWLAPDAGFETATAEFVHAVLADEAIASEVAGFVAELAPAWRVTSLAQKLVQLTMPGVADTYQGTELFELSLVDPDNRRPVDYSARSRLLAQVPGSPAPTVDDSGRAKLHVTSQALRLRREHPEWFVTAASYQGVAAGPRALAFLRSERVLTVVPLRAVETERQGWGTESMLLPAGSWRNALTGASHSGGQLPLAELLSDFPVALLVRR